MGCWNKTCGVTQFPLMSGQKVVTFILVQSGHAADNNPTYIGNNGWSSIPVPFFGEYNDYGWMEGGDAEDEQRKLDYINKHFEGLVIPNPQQEKRAALCYPNLSAPFDDIESIGDTIHGDVYHIKNNFKNSDYGSKVDNKLAGFMVSKIIWDKLTSRNLEQIVKTINDFIKFIGDKPVKSYTLSEKSAVMEEYGRLTAKDYTPTTEDLERILELDDAIGEILAEMRDSYDDKIDRFIKKHVKNEYWWYDPGACAIKSIFTSINYKSDSGMEFPLHKLLNAGIIDVECAARLYNFYTAMSSLRKQFAPQIGEGSQEGYSDFHDLLIAGMAEMKKSYEDEYNEIYGEDEEDDEEE